MGKKRRDVEEKTAPKQSLPHKASSLRAFFDRHAGKIALLAVLVASARIVATYHIYSHTFDEPPHIACGLEWLDKGTYTWEPQHPPLARVAMALGPYLLGAHSEHGPGQSEEGLRILYSGGHYDLSLSLARLGVLPFFWIACWVVYEWGRRYYDRVIAAVSVCVFTFVPTVLAHAGLATTELAVTAFLGAAFLTGMLWLEEPSAKRAALFGLCGGLAILSKFSSLMFFPAAAALALFWYLAGERPAPGVVLQAIQRRAVTLLLAAAVCFFTIWAGYRFSVGKVAFANLTLPFPELFSGVATIQQYNHMGHPGYLLGERSQTGWWYFFPVALGVKTPLAYLLLLFLGIYLCTGKGSGFRRAWVPLAFAAAILLTGMTSTINIGLRHILPVYLGFSILVAVALCWLLERSRGPAIAAAILVAWFAGSSLLSHPDYLPYFNELAGSHPENILVDSDLDWGQDFKRLAARLKQLGARELTLFTGSRIDYEKMGLPPRRDKMDVLHPPPGWCAISLNIWKQTRLGLWDQYPQYTIWPDLIPPTEKIGKGIYLWYTPPAAAGN